MHLVIFIMFVLGLVYYNNIDFATVSNRQPPTVFCITFVCSHCLFKLANKFCPPSFSTSLSFGHSWHCPIVAVFGDYSRRIDDYSRKCGQGLRRALPALVHVLAYLRWVKCKDVDRVRAHCRTVAVFVRRHPGRAVPSTLEVL